MRRKTIKKVINLIPNNTSTGNEYLELIDKIYYINLEKRKDRNREILEELTKISPLLHKVERFNAIEKNNGLLGCTMSHLAVIKDAIKKNYKNIIIFEDDFQFTSTIEEINKSLNNLLFNIKDFNICMLSANIIKSINYKDGLLEALNAQTMSGYVVNNKIFEKLKDNLTIAVNNLSLGRERNIFACDQYWKKLQGKGKKFYILKKRIGKQRESYSDIENNIVNYGV